MKKSIVHIALTLDKQFAKYGAIVIQSIMNYASTERLYELYLFTKGVGLETRELLEDMFRLKENVSMHWFDLSEEVRDREATLIRFYLMEKLPCVEKLLYVDSDTLPLCDLAELYDIDLEEAWIGGVRDYPLLARPEAARKRDVNYLQKQVGINNPGKTYFNAGVMLMNLAALREQHIGATKCFDVLDSYVPGYKWKDQDVLNILCRNHVKYLPIRWNLMRFVALQNIEEPPERELIQSEFDQPKIVHFAGDRKPWGIKYYDGGCGNWHTWREAWWQTAQTSPFFMTVLQSWIQLIIDKKNKTLKETVQLPYFQWELRRIKWKLYFSLGKRRQRLLKRKKQLKEKIKAIEKVLKST